MIKKQFRKFLKWTGYSLVQQNKFSTNIYNILFKQYGLLNSIEKKECIDNLGNPIPWFTYPSIDFLKQLNLKDKTVLEWGSGNSSRFFAQRVKEIFSIEHSFKWIEKMNQCLLSNQHLVTANETNYISKATDIEKKFDIIIIDGILREKCIEIAPSLLNDGGIIVFDNSERQPDLCENLRNKGFIESDFHGFGPINEYTWTTSVFFHRNYDFKPLNNQPQVPIGGGH
jgi:hypothetical protein